MGDTENVPHQIAAYCGIGDVQLRFVFVHWMYLINYEGWDALTVLMNRTSKMHAPTATNRNSVI